ncbi:T9SS type A sorting domain-containing protein [uncultured Croceitalea sp.]|uniref:T9SS type A sorting domain-containing protein n=1 Tax=uncultured Croceitalea sp. TaxID=1798908 RepID=UPI003305A9E0
MKNIILGCFILCTFFMYSQEYKVGVHLFKRETGNLATENETGKTLDSIIASISANKPNRTTGSKTVKLVIGLEVPWKDTEINQGVYNFDWYISFAALCESKGIKWTPLLSPHYVPEFYKNMYSADKLNYVDQTPYTEFNFLYFSPSSDIWNNEVAKWIKEFIDEMSNANHFSTLSTPNGAIEELLVGNEMIYPFNKTISGDDATIRKWNQENPSIAYPVNSNQFIGFWNNTTLASNPLKDFRNKQLAYCIGGMIHVAKSQLTLRLGSNNADNIGVSSKLYPYLFPRTNIAIADEICGYDNAQLGYLINLSNKFVAIDSYTDPDGWDLIDDYNATNGRTSPSNKSIYLSEFNRKDGFDSDSPFLATDFSNFLTAYPNIKYFVFFAWNPMGIASNTKITEGQILGLYNMINDLVPIENGTGSSSAPKPNNYASGAYTIPEGFYSPENLNYNFQHLYISENTVDWYKFYHKGNVYYLKVTQKPDDTRDDARYEKYGLHLTYNSCNILTAKIYGDTQIDTKIFLYDANLFELTNNDDYISNNTFSKLLYDLDDVNNNTSNRSVSSQNIISQYETVLNENQKLKEDTNPFEVILSPNPSQEFIKITVKGISEKYNLKIIDFNNKLVFKESQISTKIIKQIDISQLQKGMYFILINTSANKTTKKMIKID